MDECAKAKSGGEGGEGLTVLLYSTAAGLLPLKRNLKMLQRVTLNVIQVFQRTFDAINSCFYYIYRYKYFFFLCSFFLVSFDGRFVGGDVVVFIKMLCRIPKKTHPFCWTNCILLSCYVFTYPAH